MMLGSDVSSLSTTAADRRGAGAVDRRARLQRGRRPRRAARAADRPRQDAAGALRAGLRSGLCRRRQRATTRSRSRAALRRCARRPGGVAVAQFRQGGRADGRARPCPARRGAVHGRRRPASADLVEKLVGHWIDDGYDVVYTAKAHRDNESFLRRLAVHGFYALINWGARQKIPEDAGDFRLLSPRAAAALRQLPERNRFFKGLASWIGFRQIRVDYEPAPRAHGVTTFSPGRLIGLSIEGLTSFSVAPLRFASLLGVLLATVGLPVRPLDPLGNLDHRQVGPRLSVAGGRPDDDRRRAAHHDRHRRRIYRQDPLRAEGAADLLRRRAYREARRWRRRPRAPPSGPPPNERCARRAGSGCAPTITA